MTLTSHTPISIRSPFAHYSHGVEVPSGSRILFASGQLGICPDDTIPECAMEQTRLCFENIGEVLKEASMTYSDIVRINAFVTDRRHLKAYMQVRDEFTSNPPPASTLIIVSGFAREEFVIEVEVIAAKKDKCMRR
ncbi:enamine deaminase RidA (YjgF/YER057c/UK114 family) [Roseibium hamelinense]|uniref:Enamine deaminase RidA (YjgF/YER057c/UK114 family) n=1 Tax=Roseibium hamelinense TaxID=150831 RepID=A0A562SMY8_9HYPH|nr:RidA family protein [Roseibium hamelinense]MTI45087.1 RidA family protein [Roseibium hamelinense]TWI82354.1 enamine deaminase RidA (YjgF/YER057c/UK114 family) [Roseibium hamelinense]